MIVRLRYEQRQGNDGWQCADSSCGIRPGCLISPGCAGAYPGYLITVRTEPIIGARGNKSTLMAFELSLGSHPPGMGDYKRKKPVLSYRLLSEMMAVRGGGGLTRFARPAGSFLAGSSSVHPAGAGCRPPVGDSHPPGVGDYKRKKPVLSYRLLSEMMAVRGGFEPPIRCRIHTFQACSFSHSDTSPHCLPDVVGTGANVGKTGTSVNLLFQ